MLHQRRHKSTSRTSAFLLRRASPQQRSATRPGAPCPVPSLYPEDSGGYGRVGRRRGGGRGGDVPALRARRLAAQAHSQGHWLPLRLSAHAAARGHHVRKSEAGRGGETRPGPRWSPCGRRGSRRRSHGCLRRGPHQLKGVPPARPPTAPPSPTAGAPNTGTSTTLKTRADEYRPPPRAATWHACRRTT